MKLIGLFLALMVSLIGNLVLLYYHIEFNKEVEKLKGPYMYQKAQSDIEVFFNKIEGKKDKPEVKAADKKEAQSTETIVETEKASPDVVKDSEQSRKKHYINYGVFSTEFFINQNVKILKDKKIPFTLKERKKGTQILIGPLSPEESNDLIKRSFMPKDAKITYDK